MSTKGLIDDDTYFRKIHTGRSYVVNVRRHVYSIKSITKFLTFAQGPTSVTPMSRCVTLTSIVNSLNCKL